MSNNVRATYHSYPLVIIILVLNIVGEVKQHLSPQRKRKEGEILKWGYYEKSRWTNTVCGGQQCAQSDQQRLLLVHSHCILLVEPSKRSPTPATTSSRWHFGSQWAIPLAVKQWGRWMKKKKKKKVVASCWWTEGVTTIETFFSASHQTLKKVFHVQLLHGSL